MTNKTMATNVAKNLIKMKMENVYVLYEGDAWLSSSSLVPMGIFDNTDDLMGAARKLIAERHSDEDEVEDMVKELGNYNQVSGYDVNYLIKVVELNKLEEF